MSTTAVADLPELVAYSKAGDYTDTATMDRHIDSGQSAIRTILAGISVVGELMAGSADGNTGFEKERAEDIGFLLCALSELGLSTIDAVDRLTNHQSGQSLETAFGKEANHETR